MNGTMQQIVSACVPVLCLLITAGGGEGFELLLFGEAAGAFQSVNEGLGGRRHRLLYRVHGHVHVVLGVMALAAFLFWIHAITNWDGSVSCDETQCDACPFPCDMSPTLIAPPAIACTVLASTQP